MKRFLQRIGRLLASDRGVTVPFFAISAIAIMGFTALAVDVGWVLLNRSRTQAAADAAALAGVTNLPGFPDIARDDARLVAAANGYNHSDSDTTVVVNPTGEAQLQVQITKPVDTFFMQVLGVTSVSITSTAVAEYAAPLEMGSPSGQLGGVDPADPTAQPFYLAVNGPRAPYQSGDPISTECAPRTGRFDSPQTGTNCLTFDNPEYDPNGYYYAVEVKPGTTAVDVQLYDAGFYTGHGGVNDPKDGDWGDPFDTTYNLHMVDNSPFDYTDNVDATCTAGSSSVTFNTETSDPAWELAWVTMCRLTPIAGETEVRPGIYPLQVYSSGAGSGVNFFAIRAVPNLGAPLPDVWGIGRMSLGVYNDGVAAFNPTFYFARVTEFHRGSSLTVRLYDAGDANGNAHISILRPDGSGALIGPPCNYSSGVPGGSGSEPNCRINATGSPGRFNEVWLEITVPIPSDYTCNPGADGCWWKIKLEYDNPTDRTTWEASVAGAPIHLVFEPVGAAP